jgi:hypothetical protein
MGPLVETIQAELATHGFVSRMNSGLEALGCLAFWKLRSWNMNRGVAILRPPQGDYEIGPYCQAMKWKLLWKTWFIPFLYELGLQIVLCGDGLERQLGIPESLRAHVDNWSNQFVVLQSIAVVDTHTRKYTLQRTWGQSLTGEYQTAIATSIVRAGYLRI